LRVFGYKTFAHILDEKRSKLEFKSIPLSNHIEHLVVDEVDELVKDVNPISLKARPAEDVDGDESTTNSSSKEEFPSSQDEGLNEPQQDGQRERPQRQRKEWPRDWWVTTKEVE